MKIFSRSEVIGDIVYLKKTNSKHFGVVKRKLPGDIEESFGALLKNALTRVNDLQIKSDKLTTKMIASPNEVNIHDVMIAAQEAQLSLNFVKSIRDKVIKAYQEIITMR